MRANRKINRKKEIPVVTSNAPKQNSEWTLSEKKALVTAIRTYGFGNIGKIAEVVKTRSGSEIEVFMNQWKKGMRKRLPKVLAETQVVAEEVEHTEKSQKSKRNESEDSNARAPLDYWIHVVGNLIQSKCRQYDYSDIFENIFRSAATHESHVDPKVPGEPNFKAIYTFFSSLLSGSVSPPPLSSTDSMLVAYLISQLSDFIQQGDWLEEKAYIKDVHLPPEFVCLEGDSAVPDCGPTPLPAETTNKKVLISNQLHSSLKLHKKVQENLNPMSIPMTLLKKEQKELEKHLISM